MQFHRRLFPYKFLTFMFIHTCFISSGKVKGEFSDGRCNRFWGETSKDPQGSVDSCQSSLHKIQWSGENAATFLLGRWWTCSYSCLWLSHRRTCSRHQAYRRRCRTSLTLWTPASLTPSVSFLWKECLKMTEVMTVAPVFLWPKVLRYT